MATGSIYRDELAFDLYCEAEETAVTDLDAEPSDAPLMAAIDLREWLAMKGELDQVRAALAQARNEIAMRPHTNEWHRLHDDLEQYRTALEEIRDTVCVAHGEERAMLARFHAIARQALEPCSRRP